MQRTDSRPHTWLGRYSTGLHRPSSPVVGGTVALKETGKKTGWWLSFDMGLGMRGFDLEMGESDIW